MNLKNLSMVLGFLIPSLSSAFDKEIDAKVIRLPTAEILEQEICNASNNLDFSQKTQLHTKLANKNISIKDTRVQVQLSIFNYNQALRKDATLPTEGIEIMCDILQQQREKIIKAIIKSSLS